jgi:hypothetical protein
MDSPLKNGQVGCGEKFSRAAKPGFGQNGMSHTGEMQLTQGWVLVCCLRTGCFGYPCVQVISMPGIRINANGALPAWN